MLSKEQRIQRFLKAYKKVGDQQYKKVRSHTLYHLVEKIKAHAYTWGMSVYGYPSRTSDDAIVVNEHYLCYFPTETSYIIDLITDMDDITSTTIDNSLVIIFTKDGRYVKLTYDYFPIHKDKDGNVIVKNINNPDDRQKPYKTHGFN